MAFCARWDSRSKYLNEIDELIIPFHGQVDKLVDFLEEHKNQRIILDIKDDWKEYYNAILQPIVLQYQNLVLRLQTEEQLIKSHLQNTSIPYFLNQVCTDWETLNAIIELKVTDVYISEQLCFELAEIQKLTAAVGVRVRVYPNIAQSARASTPALKTFFVRPEDVDIYNRRYISTFEFYYPEDVDINWDVLYRAYAIKKRWRGPLKEIIFGFNNDLDSTYVSPRWAELRMTCRRKCLKGDRCFACAQIAALARSFEQIQVMPILPKDPKAAAKEVLEVVDSKNIDNDKETPLPVIPNF